MICVDCGTSAPQGATATWLGAHVRAAHHLPRRLECRWCHTAIDAASLHDARDWAWRHATCGLPSLPSELYTSLTRKAAGRPATRSGRRRRRQRRGRVAEAS